MTEALHEMPEDWTRALAVAAHPDDLEFGAAGAVAAWTAAGKNVSYLLVSRGEAGIDGMAPSEAAKVREEEQKASAAIVGVNEVEFLDHPDGVIEYGPGLRRELADAIRRYRPDLVIGFNHRELSYTGRWNSPDHRATGLALLDAVADAGNRWIFAEASGAGAPEPWGGVRFVAIAGSPQPTHAVDITDTIETAVASVEAHSAYLRGLGVPPGGARSPLEGFAHAIGQRFGGRPAIPFELIQA